MSQPARPKATVSSLCNTISKYTFCQKCQSLLAISRTSLPDNLNRTVIQIEADWISIEPTSNIFNMKLSGNFNKWMLVCQNCKTQVGNIDSGNMQLLSNKVYKSQLIYKNGDNSKYPQGRKTNKQTISNESTRLHKIQSINQMVKKYISLTFQSLNAKLNQINLEKLNQKQGDIHNFIKFYEKFKRKNQN